MATNQSTNDNENPKGPAQDDAKAPDPFDPARLRLTETTQIGVKKVPTVITCDKPNRHQFVRTHPDEVFRTPTAIFTDQVQREHYLVERNLWDDLAGDVLPTILFAAITRTNNVFIWPCRIPDTDGRRNNWHTSALAAAELARSKWVRVSANMPDGKYDVYEATRPVPEPEWPDLDFRGMLRLCFGDRHIDSLYHPILKQLRGEV